MHLFTRSKIILLISAIIFSITSCEESEDVFSESVSIISTKNQIKIGEELQLKSSVTPYSGQLYYSEWKSSSGHVASVNAEGLVKGLKEGKTDIILTVYGKSQILSDTLAISVSAIEVEKIEILQDTIKIKEGETCSIEYNITPSNATNKFVEWHSSEPSIAKVANGNVEAISSGICTIFAKSSNNKMDSTIVEVFAPQLLGVTVNEPGSLRDAIGGKDSFDSIKRLKVNGVLNAYDIEDIRNMKFLYYLDMSDVKLVPGGVYGGNNKIVENILDDWMFEGLNLKKIILPKSVKIIDFHVFDGCKKLEECILPDSLESTGYCSFYDCSSLNNIVFPESLKKLGYHSFTGCISLKEVVIPNSVYFIDTNAFSFCTGLEKIVFGSGIKEMGQWIFYECKDIKSVYMNTIPDEETIISTNIFDEGIYSKAILYIPRGSKESFKHTPFEKFKKIEEF